MTSDDAQSHDSNIQMNKRLFIITLDCVLECIVVFMLSWLVCDVVFRCCSLLPVSAGELNCAVPSRNTCRTLLDSDLCSASH